MTTIAQRQTPAAPGALDGLVGVGTLLRFMLRRDRIRLPGWVLGLTLMMTYFTTALQSLLATPEDVAGMAGFATTPVGALFGGPGLGYDNLTIERFLASQYGLYILLGAALMGLLTVTRHTRAEERSGRAELVRANVVGRHAQLTAALVLAAVMSVLVAVLIAGVMAGAGFDAAGSVVFGAGVGAGGLVFAGIAAITVQLSEYPRAVAGMAGTVLGAAFVLRGLGDMAAVQGSGPSWLSWLSPLGWSQQTGPYVFDRWWPLVLSLLFAAGTTAAGYVLSARRDLGAGLVPPRPGSPVAASWLRSPRTLAFRLHRGSLVGWSTALLVAGLAYGAFTQPMIDGFADAPEDLVAVMGGGEDMLNGFLGLMGLMMAFTVSVFAVLAMQSVRGEETDGRTEPVLATAVSRPGWLGGHVAVIGLGVLWLLLVAGIGMGVGGGGEHGGQRADRGPGRRPSRAHAGRVARPRGRRPALRRPTPSTARRVADPRLRSGDGVLRADPRPPRRGREPLALRARRGVPAGRHRRRCDAPPGGRRRSGRHGGTPNLPPPGPDHHLTGTHRASLRGGPR
jgi:ABC-2 type transport system permease protein